MTVPTWPAYNIQIAMDTATVRELKGGGYTLYAFLGAGWTNAPGLLTPLLWFSSQEFSETTEVSWTPQVQVFVSSSEIAPNGLIVPSSSIDVSSPTVGLKGPSLQLTSIAWGYHTWFDWFAGSSSVTGGLSQLIQGQYNPHCAFELAPKPGGCVLRPIVPKVLLMIAVDTIKIGAVVLKAFTDGVCVDQTEEIVEFSAKVKFALDSGWSWTPADQGPFTKITAVTTNQDIAALLTEELDGSPSTP